MRWNQITLPVLLMISGPLTLPPAGVMKISPLPLSAPCFSTMTAGAFARTAAPEVTVVHAAPAKAMTAATAAAAPARGALFRREPATRHETPLSPSRSSTLQAVTITIGRYPRGRHIWRPVPEMTVTVLDRALVAGDAGRVTGERQERPHPEVLNKARHETFTGQYKLDVVAEYDAASAGEQGAVLRGEALVSSHVTEWRRARDAGAGGPGRCGRVHALCARSVVRSLCHSDRAAWRSFGTSGLITGITCKVIQACEIACICRVQWQLSRDRGRGDHDCPLPVAGLGAVVIGRPLSPAVGPGGLHVVRDWI